MPACRNRHRTTLRSLAQAAVLAALLLLALRWTAGLTLPLVASVILFLLLSPAAEALQNRKLPGPAAAALLVFAPVLVLTAAAVMAAPAALAWTTGIAAAIARLGRSLDPLAQHADAAGASARWIAQGLRSLDGGIGAWAGRQALPFLLTAASVVMLTFFLLLAQRSMLVGLLKAVKHPRAQVRLLHALRRARTGIANYLRVMTVMNVLLAVATAAVLWGLGMPDAPVWAVVIALLLFIPYLGPLAITLLLVAAAPTTASSPLETAAPALTFLALHALEANLISPWVMGRGVRIGRPALLVAVIVGGWTWGAVGGVLAVPILIVMRAGLNAVDGHAVVTALLEGEDGDAPSLASTGATLIAQRSAARRSSQPSHAGHRTIVDIRRSTNPGGRQRM